MSSTRTRLLTLLFGAAALAVTAVAERAEAQGYQYYAVTPCRIVDTRVANPFQLPPRDTAGSPLTAYYPPPSATWWGGPFEPLNPTGIRVRLAPLYDGTGSCGVPTNATAVSLNSSIVNPTIIAYFTLWPTNADLPTVSNMIVGQGEMVSSNGAIVPLGPYSAGNPDIYIRLTKGTSPAGTGHVLLDITGYFAP